MSYIRFQAGDLVQFEFMKCDRVGLVLSIALGALGDWDAWVLLQDVKLGRVWLSMLSDMYMGQYGEVVARRPEGK